MLVLPTSPMVLAMGKYHQPRGQRLEMGLTVCGDMFSILESKVLLGISPHTGILLDQRGKGLTF